MCWCGAKDAGGTGVFVDWGVEGTGGVGENIDCGGKSFSWEGGTDVWGGAGG